ncbi:MAG: hypothetical protein JXQ29_09430 [Planctomycetes bacterium]|nr:hypothetical protein [Planctomycetota bacterium]
MRRYLLAVVGPRCPGKAGVLLVCAALLQAVRAGAQTAPQRDLLPSDALLAIEADSAEAVLSALAGAARLFAPPGRTAAAEAVRQGDDGAVWQPYLPAASALLHTLELPYEESLRFALARWLELSRGPVAFGLVAQAEAGDAPVLAFTLPAGRRLEPPVHGMHQERAGLVWVASPARWAAEALRAHVSQLPGSERTSGAGHRIRWNLGEIQRRRPWMLDTTLGVLRHYVALSPRAVEVVWEPSRRDAAATEVEEAGAQSGEETVRLLGFGDFAGMLEPDAGMPTPRHADCSIRLAGRLRVPEGLEAAPALLGRDPLGILSALVCSWPVAAPDAARLARELTGRFQVLVVRGSGQFVPVVGLELSHAVRGRRELDRLLVESGVCERQQTEPVPFTYPRRKPLWLIRNDLLQHLFRQYSATRSYQVATAGGWVWLGPRDEMRDVLLAVRSERRAVAPGEELRASATRRAGGIAGGGSPRPAAAGGRLGWIEVNPLLLWDALVFEHGSIDGDEDREEPHDRLVQGWQRRLADQLGPLAFAVTSTRPDLVLRREIPIGRSLLVVAAARAYRSWGAIWDHERQVRRRARGELALLDRVRRTLRANGVRALESLAGLSASGLWEPDPEVARYYRFGVAAAQDGTTWLYAVPAANGPAGRRPTYLVDAAGRLLTGTTGAGGGLALPAGDPAADGWRVATAD